MAKRIHNWILSTITHWWAEFTAFAVFGLPVDLKLYWGLFVCLMPSSYKTRNQAWTSVATLHLLGFPFFTLLGMVGGEKWLGVRTTKS